MLSLAAHFSVLYFLASIPLLVVSTDLTSQAKKLHRRVGVGRVLTSVRLGGVMVGTLAWNKRYVASIPDLGINISHFHQTYFPF